MRCSRNCADSTSLSFPGEPVVSVAPDGDRWRMETGSERWTARRLVLATGGLSVPKTGSDGSGLRMAASLGHTIVPTTPALVALVLEGSFHLLLSGVSHEAAVEVTADGKTVARLVGPLLWTHFGISGPAALDASRHWLRAVARDQRAGARLSFLPGMDFAAVERMLVAAVASSPASTVRATVASRLPGAVADALLDALALNGGLQLAQFPRDDRRRLAHALTGWDLRITGSRGYNYAEATAGGVALDEVDHRTMESRRHQGLHLVGEILDVDGRLGGFNFQWAWSSAWVAGNAAAVALA